MSYRNVKRIYVEESCLTSKKYVIKYKSLNKFEAWFSSVIETLYIKMFKGRDCLYLKSRLSFKPTTWRIVIKKILLMFELVNLF